LLVTVFFADATLALALLAGTFLRVGALDLVAVVFFAGGLAALLVAEAALVVFGLVGGLADLETGLANLEAGLVLEAGLF
jgi:hypothetical protein